MLSSDRNLLTSLSNVKGEVGRAEIHEQQQNLRKE